MNKFLFLDFDGVLFDTAIEAFNMAFQAYYRYEYCSDAHEKIYDLFKANRYLIAPAWNYFYLFQAIDRYIISGKSVAGSFRELLVQSNKVQYEEFEANFFAYRKYMRENNFERWISLNTQYPFFDMIKKHLFGNHNLTCYVLSTKDEETISAILNFYNVIFPTDRILGKSYFDRFANKAGVIKKIMSGEDSSKAIFIDDALEHLNACSGIDNLLTIRNNWGYVEPGAENVYNCDEVVSLIHRFYEEEL